MCVTNLKTYNLNESKAEEKLQENEEIYRTIFENTGIAIVVFEEDATISLANEKFAELAGYTIDEIENKKKWTEFVVEENLEMMKTRHRLRKVDPSATPKSYEFSAIDRYGKIRNILLNIDIIPGTKQRIASFLNITENKRTEEALRINEEKYRTVLQDIHEGYFEVDLAGNFTFFNDSLCEYFNSSKEELMGMNYRQYTDKTNAKELFQTFNTVYNSGEPAEGFDWQVIRKDGTKRYVEASVSLRKDSSEKPIGFRGIARDVTERRQTEEMLRQEQNFSKLVLDNLPGIFYLYTYPENRMVLWNKQVETLLGFTDEEMKGRHVTEWFPVENREAVLKGIERVIEKGQNTIESPLIAKDGHQIPFFLTGIKLDVHGRLYFMGMGMDITERKKAEEALKKSEAKYRDIFENATEGIYQSTSAGLFITANAALARMTGYDSPEELIESVKNIENQLYVHPEDRKRILEIVEAKGFVDGFEVEFFKKDGSTFWVVINAHTVKDEEGKFLFIEGLIEDITIRKYAEEDLHRTLDMLRKAVFTTIQVLMTAIESRDPYTAGHQKRVADLARAIATEMGLSHDKIEGIRMTGSIHDIGKLSIPSEILVKPAKLTNIEFSLIKEHAQIGYDILKDVESPWPLAQIIYQHHERMDGSGYPRKLIGDEILLEARILAVADVVDSMSTHRPYRPALPLEFALEEISQNRGILYDANVVDACLRLFRERKFTLNQM